jgi:TPR repeat protein
MAGPLLLIISSLILLLSVAACEDRRADKAYLRGDYDKALVDIQFLAHGGEARAQYDLALMYDKGQGVPQSDAEAMRWYERAAAQGEPRAQYNLGLMHLNGQGVPPDVVKAYYWISLSARHGNAHALDARDYLSEKMSAGRLPRGNDLSRNMKTLCNSDPRRPCAGLSCCFPRSGPWRIREESQ